MDLENRIVEQRTTEAIKKNLMGYEGKIFLVSKILGHELVKESEGSEVLDFYEIYAESDEDSMPTFAEDSYSYPIGHSFDGLGYGYHINITFMEYENTIKIWYKGNLVYSETAGVLQSYMDGTAIALCKDNSIPIVVFDLFGPGNIGRAVSGEPIGTRIQPA
jgi:hypothetical protein